MKKKYFNMKTLRIPVLVAVIIAMTLPQVFAVFSC